MLIPPDAHLMLTLPDPPPPTHTQIVSGSRDKSIKLWNTLGECKYTIADNDGHSEWVSCVRFSPLTTNPVIVSAGWDKLVKVWNLTNCKLKCNLVGHTGYINTVTVSPDGSLCASGGKDGVAMLWDLGEGKRLYSLDAGDIIHSLCFSPNRCVGAAGLLCGAALRQTPKRRTALLHRATGAGRHDDAAV